MIIIDGKKKPWERDNLERVAFNVPKGKKEVLKDTAAKHNKNINQTIIAALENQYGIDLSSKD